MTASFRMNRLFDPRSGRALDVAMDHGVFGEPRLLEGINDLESAVAAIADSGVDAIQLTPGTARLLQRRPGGRPALVLRADVADVYGSQIPSSPFSAAVPGAIDEAIRLDAVAVCVNLLSIPEHPEILAQCVSNVAALRHEASAVGMPLMVEPLVMRRTSDGYGVDGRTRLVVTLARQARELGADLIKADPTDEIADFHLVVETAGDVPVLVRGGGRVSDEELVKRTKAVLEQGARGVVIGRNVVQHPDPKRIARALLALIHEGISTEDALRRLRRPDAA